MKLFGLLSTRLHKLLQNIFVTPCLTIVYYSIPSSGLGIKPDIDFIIEKILSSDKINVLIERVADRAVEKIKSQMRIETKGRQSEQRYPGKREQKPNVLRNEEGNVKLKEMPITSKYQKQPERTAYRGQPGKIDIQAVREKYASFPYEQLSLKYKKLISNGREREETATERNAQNYEDKNNFETIMLKPERPERSPMKKEKQYEIIKFRSEEKKPEDFDMSTDNQKELKSKHLLENENIRESKALYAKMNENNEDLQIDQEENFFDSKFKAQNDEQPKPKQTLSESMNKMFRGKGNRSFKNKDESLDQDATNGDILDEKIDNEQEDGIVEERKEESKIIITNDGDKVFAVGNSPDYEEYNDNFKKSELNNNNDDDK